MIPQNFSLLNTVEFRVPAKFHVRSYNEFRILPCKPSRPALPKPTALRDGDLSLPLFCRGSWCLGAVGAPAVAVHPAVDDVSAAVAIPAFCTEFLCAGSCERCFSLCMLL
jgi:hypothetical protein